MAGVEIIEIGGRYNYKYLLTDLRESKNLQLLLWVFAGFVPSILMAIL
jgi:hypothetical protein